MLICCSQLRLSIRIPSKNVRRSLIQIGLSSVRIISIPLEQRSDEIKISVLPSRPKISGSSVRKRSIPYDSRLPSRKIPSLQNSVRHSSMGSRESVRNPSIEWIRRRPMLMPSRKRIPLSVMPSQMRPSVTIVMMRSSSRLPLLRRILISVRRLSIQPRNSIVRIPSRHAMTQRDSRTWSPWVISDSAISSVTKNSSTNVRI